MITAGNERVVGRPMAVRLPPAWVGFVFACGVLSVAYYALPIGKPAQSFVYTLVAGGAAGALTAGAFVRRPTAWMAWALLAAGQAVYTVADMLYYITANDEGEVPYPGPADVFYLAAYPLLAAGLVILVRRRTPKWQTATLIDATVLGLASTLLWWVYVLHPIAAASGGSLVEQSVSTAYAALDLLVFVVALRLMLGSGVRTTAYYLILASLGLMLAADCAYAVQNAWGTWQDYTWVDALWLGSYALLGAAALHPSMRRIDDRSQVSAPDATPRRLTTLAVASLAGPTVLIVEHLRGRSGDVVMIGVVCGLMFLLVLGRMTGLVALKRHEAMTDGLTGLYTRRFFEENLRVEAERAYRSDGEVALLLVDVDHFKDTNDTHGHPGGDKVLVELARRLRAICRPGDIVARVGGEEFAVLLPGAGRVRAHRHAERIRRFVSGTPFTVTESVLQPTTVSIGVAVLPGDGRTTTDLVRAADQALYRAKHAGRNRVVTAGTAPQMSRADVA